jgi:GntR family transcriptional repressor for pyruvate dehydrogenase complex
MSDIVTLRNQVDMELKRIKTQDLQDQIQEQIKNYIVRRSLRGGDPLPTEKELAESLGTSRTAIRESLKAMESLGIIEVRPGIGRFIRDFNFEAILNNLPYSLETDIRNFKDVLEVRVSLESFFICRDISLFTAADIATLEDILLRLEAKVKEDSEERELIGLHTDFHCTLYRNSNNRLLINLIKIFATIQRSLTLINRYRSVNRPLFIDQHRNIVEAIKSRDPARARKFLLKHFEEPMSWVERHQGLIGTPHKVTPKEEEE